MRRILPFQKLGAILLVFSMGSDPFALVSRGQSVSIHSQRFDFFLQQTISPSLTLAEHDLHNGDPGNKPTVSTRRALSNLSLLTQTTTIEELGELFKRRLLTDKDQFWKFLKTKNPSLLQKVLLELTAAKAMIPPERVTREDIVKLDEPDFREISLIVLQRTVSGFYKTYAVLRRRLLKQLNVEDAVLKTPRWMLLEDLGHLPDDLPTLDQLKTLEDLKRLFDSGALHEMPRGGWGYLIHHNPNLMRALVIELAAAKARVAPEDVSLENLLSLKRLDYVGITLLMHRKTLAGMYDAFARETPAGESISHYILESLFPEFYVTRDEISEAYLLEDVQRLRIQGKLPPHLGDLWNRLPDSAIRALIKELADERKVPLDQEIPPYSAYEKNPVPSLGRPLKGYYQNRAAKRVEPAPTHEYMVDSAGFIRSPTSLRVRLEAIQQSLGHPAIMRSMQIWHVILATQGPRKNRSAAWRQLFDMSTADPQGMLLSLGELLGAADIDVLSHFIRNDKAQTMILHLHPSDRVAWYQRLDTRRNRLDRVNKDSGRTVLFAEKMRFYEQLVRVTDANAARLALAEALKRANPHTLSGSLEALHAWRDALQAIFAILDSGQEGGMPASLRDAYQRLKMEGRDIEKELSDVLGAGPMNLLLGGSQNRADGLLILGKSIPDPRREPRNSERQLLGSP